MTEQRTRPVDLDEMLEARERRYGKHRAYVLEYACPALLLTMNIPGPEKSGPEVARCFDEGFQALCRALDRANIPLRGAEAHNYDTGPEGYLGAAADARTLKQLAVSLEEQHPQGRLFDIDVMDLNGRLISRGDVGLEERRCFLCGESAKACGRSRRHSVEELTAAVREMMGCNRDAPLF